MRTELDKYAKALAKQVRNSELAVFAGAGLSAGAGFVDWATLLKPIAEELGLDSSKERENLVRLAQFSVNAKSGHRHHLNQALIEAFPKMARPGKNHEILASMPISTYWTTNYDTLIERSLGDARKVVDVKWNDSHLPASTARRDAVVYKMHGDIASPDEAILTRDDYESYAYKRPGLINALLGDLTVKTFLFIGFSFMDPNLDHVLSEVRQRYKKSAREHYCILRKLNKKDYPKAAELSYALAKQELFVADLRRFNITTIIIDEYSEIPKFLSAVSRYSRRDSVFVSGSVVDYSPWPKEEVEKFLLSLGALLAEKNKRIVSGLGLQVGNLVVSGAVEHAYLQNQVSLHSLLEVRPFPQRITAAADQARIWKAYRSELVRSAGVAIFVFGNKEEKIGGPIVIADGMIEEFKIALENGLHVVPVGGTGSAAKVLFDQVMGEFNKYYPGDTKLRNIFQNFGATKALHEYLKDISAVLNHLADI